MATVKWRFVLVAAFAIGADAQTVVWTKFDPGAIRVGRTDPAVLEVQLNSTVSGVALDYAGGGRLNLTASGPNRWTASVDAAHLLSGYALDDVNHNFVGFLRLLGSAGQTLVTYNQFINVIDANVPAVMVTQLGGGAQATSRILNLHRPALSVSDLQPAAQQFYTYYRDDFDFLSIAFSMPNYPANRFHFAVRNDVSGIGLLPLNAGSIYGSASRLLGITVFPIDTFFDAGETAFVHELGHQWIAFLKNSSLVPGPHWPPSTMARGIMGWNIPPTNEGGDFPWNITPVSANTARINAGAVTREFDDDQREVGRAEGAESVAPERRRRVDEDELVVARDFVERAAKAKVGVASVLALALGEDSAGREDVDTRAPARFDDGGSGRLRVGQRIGRAERFVAGVDPERVRG